MIFQEAIDLSKRLFKEFGRPVGIYPETKHPTYFRQQGLPLEPELIKTLNRNGLNRPDAKVFVQSFEVSNLKALDKQLRVPLVQLTSSAGAPYADGVGPSKDQIVPLDAAGKLGKSTSLVADARKAGLVVHPYTFRVENTFLPADFDSSAVASDSGNLFAEIAAYRKTGVDGLFTDNTDIAVAEEKEAR